MLRIGSFAVTCLALAVAFECDTIVDAVAQDAGSSGLSNIAQQLQQPGQVPQSVQNILDTIHNGGATQSGPAVPQTTVTTVTPSTAIGTSTMSPGPSSEVSKTEEDYSRRTGLDLRQFGYDIIGNKGTVGTLQLGAVQDDYIMGQGDDILVTLRGQENDTYDVSVDRDGKVTLPKLHPIPAAGRRFGDFRNELDAAIKSAFVQTQAFITINSVRQLSVSVEGEEVNPGIYAATGLSTVLDVLQLAGGLKKSGSLRRIYLVRRGSAVTLDLYQMFGVNQGTSPNKIVEQGDRIIVPPIGPTFAVAGRVLHEKIFELPPGNQAVSIASAMKYAGGLLRPGAYRYDILRIRPDGKGELVDVSRTPQAMLNHGEVLFVDPAVDRTIGEVTLAGAVRVPGLYGLNEAKTLHDLLHSPDNFMPDAYMLLGFIKRYNEKTVQKEVVPFSPLKILEGTQDIALQTDDVVHILTIDSMRAVVAAELQNGMQATLQPGSNNNAMTNGAQPSQTGGSAISSMLSAITQAAGANGSGQGNTAMGGAGSFGANAPTGATAATTTGSSAGTSSAMAALGADLSDAETSEFGTVLSDYRVMLDGDVRDPGYYLAAPGTTLDELLAAARGLRPDANTNMFEVTSTIFNNAGGISHTTRTAYTIPPARYSEVVLQRLDTVRFNPVFEDRENDATAYIGGEVRYPGTYDVLRGERLSSLIARAGGLTEQAYPYGAVFTRDSVAQQQALGFQREAKDLQDQMMYLVAEGQSANSNTQATASAAGLDVGAATFIQGLITQLKTQAAAGRMQIVADPALLAVHPAADVVLQAGDSLVIPKRPSDVTVVGDVQSPGSFLVAPNLDYSDYIDLAGGYGRTADEGETFVIYPNGVSQSAGDTSIIGFSSTTLPPGSVVVVPKELKPLDSERLMMDIFKAISDLALSAAAVAVLAQNS